MKRLASLFLSTLTFLIIVTATFLSTAAAQADAAMDKNAGINELLGMSFEELMDVEIDVASLFLEDEFLVGSTVSCISPKQWKKHGARRLTDALESQTSIVSHTATGGFRVTSIRGYTRHALSTKGVVTLVDGIPVLLLNDGGSDLANFGLGTLDSIEIIKGPGSAIYGSDAFHGVISLKTFESDKDHYSAEAAGAYPLYTDGNVKISQGIGDLIRINAAGSYNQQIASEDLEYDYVTSAKQVGVPFLTYEGQPAAAGSGKYKNKYKTTTGVVKLTVNPADKIKLNLKGYAIKNIFENFPGVKESSLYIQLNQFDQSSQNSTLYMGQGSATYTFNNDIAIEAKGYYWNWKIIFDQYYHHEGRYSLAHVYEYRNGIDLIIKQPGNPMNLQWLIAYSMTNAKVSALFTQIYDINDQPFITPLFNNTNKLTYPSDGMSRTIHSVYAQTKWGILKDCFFLLLGGRLDNYSDWGTQFTPRGGIIFLPTDKSSIKALYGRAFRAPSGSAVNGITGYSLGNPDIEPETIDIYELIFMYKNKTLKTTLNGFYSNWKNGIIIEPFTPYAITQWHRAEYTNSGKNRAYGGEFNLFYSIAPFAIDIGFSYVISEAIDLQVKENPTDLTTLITSAQNVKYGTFPEYIIICGLHYSLEPLDINFFLNNRIYLNMEETSEPSETDNLPTFWRIDLNISKEISKRLELLLDIKNLTNRRNYMPSLYYSMMRTDETGIPEPGISVLFRASYKL